MRRCPACGFHNPETKDRCVKCSASLVSQMVPDGSGAADLPEPGPRVDIAGQRLLAAIRGRLHFDLPTGLPHRFPWSAAYLAMLFGAGQAYNRQYAKAVLFGLIQVAVLAVFLLTFFKPWNDWIALAALAWLFYAMSDAYSCAVKINGDSWRWRHLVAVWFALFFFVGSFVFLLQVFGNGLLFLTTINSRGLSPAFEKRDKVLVLAWPFKNWWVQPGTVVYYNPPAFSMIRPGALSTDVYTLNERNSFGVITALPGQTISRNKGGPIMVNGLAVPPRLLPLIPAGALDTFEVPIPADHYGVVFSHRVSEEGPLSLLGGAFGGTVPTPRQAEGQGFGVRDYDVVTRVPKGEVYGIVLFRFHPPERRAWFGTSGGIWSENPAGYPDP